MPMRSRQLEDALRRFLDEAGALLRAELAAGAEVPFEVGSRSARGPGLTPLYCYKALTGEFIAERDAAIKRLPAHAEAVRSLGDYDGLARYLAAVAGEEHISNGRPRARAAYAARALLEDVFDEQTDFELRPERVRNALERLEQAEIASPATTTIVATLHGLAITSPEVALTKGLTIAHPNALRGMPEALVTDTYSGRGEGHIVVCYAAEHEDPGAALKEGREVIRELLRALRLFGDGRITLGALAWARIGRGSWSPLALRTGGRPHGMLVVAPEQEDELRAFCNLVSRRAPRNNELAWALRRFELGCERESSRGGADRPPARAARAARARGSGERAARGAAGRAVRHARAAGRADRADRRGDRARALRSPAGASARHHGRASARAGGRRSSARAAQRRDLRASVDATSRPSPTSCSNVQTPTSRHRIADARGVRRELGPGLSRVLGRADALSGAPARRGPGRLRRGGARGSGRARSSSRAQTGDGRPVALHEHLEVGQVGRRASPRAARALGRAAARSTSSGGVAAEAAAVDAVDDQPAARHARRALSRSARNSASRGRLGLGRGDDQERRLRIAQQRGDAAGALAEAVEHAGERAEEAATGRRACRRP